LSEEPGGFLACLGDAIEFDQRRDVA